MRAVQIRPRTLFFLPSRRGSASCSQPPEIEVGLKLWDLKGSVDCEGKCVHLAKEFAGFAVKTAVLPLKVDRCEAVPREAARPQRM
jgi:hypothetical protein